MVNSKGPVLILFRVEHIWQEKYVCRFVNNRCQSYFNSVCSGKHILKGKGNNLSVFINWFGHVWWASKVEWLTEPPDVSLCFAGAGWESCHGNSCASSSQLNCRVSGVSRSIIGNYLLIDLHQLSCKIDCKAVPLTVLTRFPSRLPFTCLTHFHGPLL